MTATEPWCDDLYYALSIVAFDSGPCFVLQTFLIGVSISQYTVGCIWKLDEFFFSFQRTDVLLICDDDDFFILLLCLTLGSSYSWFTTLKCVLCINHGV